MYARTLEVPLIGGSIGEATHYFRQFVGPALRRQGGFLGSRWLIDVTHQRALMVSYWESEADRQRADANGFLQTVLQPLQLYYAGPPSIGSYQVAVLVT